MMKDEYYNEVWMPVINGNGRYDVSNYGRMRTYLNNKWGMKKTPTLMKLIEDAYGYMTVNLRIDGKYKNSKVHRLEVAAFRGKELERWEHIDHINTVRHDNRLENLRVVTQAENNRNPITRIKFSLSHKGKKLDLSDEQRERFSQISKDRWSNERDKMLSSVIASIGKSVTLRSVTDGTELQFPTKTAASRYFGYSDSKVSTYIRRAREKGVDFITLKGLKFYYSENGQITAE